MHTYVFPSIYTARSHELNLGLPRIFLEAQGHFLLDVASNAPLTVLYQVVLHCTICSAEYIHKLYCVQSHHYLGRHAPR